MNGRDLYSTTLALQRMVYDVEKCGAADEAAIVDRHFADVLAELLKKLRQEIADKSVKPKVKIQVEVKDTAATWLEKALDGKPAWQLTRGLLIETQGALLSELSDFIATLRHQPIDTKRTTGILKLIEKMEQKQQLQMVGTSSLSLKNIVHEDLMKSVIKEAAIRAANELRQKRLLKKQEDKHIKNLFNLIAAHSNEFKNTVKPPLFKDVSGKLKELAVHEADINQAKKGNDIIYLFTALKKYFQFVSKTLEQPLLDLDREIDILELVIDRTFPQSTIKNCLHAKIDQNEPTYCPYVNQRSYFSVVLTKNINTILKAAIQDAFEARMKKGESKDSIYKEIYASIPALQVDGEEKKQEVIARIKSCCEEHRAAFSHPYPKDIDLGLLAMLVPPPGEMFVAKLNISRKGKEYEGSVLRVGDAEEQYVTVIHPDQNPNERKSAQIQTSSSFKKIFRDAFNFGLNNQDGSNFITGYVEYIKAGNMAGKMLAAKMSAEEVIQFEMHGAIADFFHVQFQQCATQSKTQSVKLDKFKDYLTFVDQNIRTVSQYDQISFKEWNAYKIYVNSEEKAKPFAEWQAQHAPTTARGLNTYPSHKFSTRYSSHHESHADIPGSVSARETKKSKR